jgi:hypothetical protein
MPKPIQVEDGLPDEEALRKARREKIEGEVAEARKVMIAAFNKDPDFFHTYVANVAMVLIDNEPPGGYDFTEQPDREDIATKILEWIF